MKTLRGFLLLLTTLSFTTAWAAPDLRVAPTSPQPGQSIFVTLHPDKEFTRAACAWDGKNYALFPTDAGYKAILPVPAGAKPGGYTLKTFWKYADGTAGAQSQVIEVRPRKFGIQRLTLSAKQEAKYEAPSVKREYRLIGAALDRITPRQLWQGNFLRPVKGRISTQYGLQRYVNGHFNYRHKGVDIAAAQGTPVKVAAEGVISLADDSFHLHGQTIIVDHGLGVSTLYLHLSRIDVAPGEEVKQGQVIGRVGSTGVATGPHLHYGLYVHHEATDPFFWMDLPGF